MILARVSGPSTASRPRDAANAGRADSGEVCSKKPGFWPYPSQLEASDGATAASSGVPPLRSTMAVSCDDISAEIFSFSSNISRAKLELVLVKQPAESGHSTIQSV